MNTENDSITKKHTIKRDGLPPIVFFGTEIGSANDQALSGSQSNRWTVVKIYKTRGGRMIVCCNDLTMWQGESDHFSANSCSSAGAVVDWLRAKDDDGLLSKVAQLAVEEAVSNDLDFANVWVEAVD